MIEESHLENDKDSIVKGMLIKFNDFDGNVVIGTVKTVYHEVGIFTVVDNENLHHNHNLHYKNAHLENGFTRFHEWDIVP